MSEHPSPDQPERPTGEVAVADIEKILASLSQIVLDPVVVIDEGGTVRLLNPSAERLFGYPSAEIVGKNVSILMPAPEAAEHDAYLKRYLETGENKVIGIGREVVATRRDGTTFPVYLSISEIHANGRHIFAGIVRDISHEKKVEADLSTSQERLALALNATSEGFWDWNLTSGHVFFSRRWAESLGFEQDEFEPHVRSWEELVHSDHTERRKEELEAHLNGRTAAYECEYLLRKKSQEYRWTLDRGKVIDRDASEKPLRMVGTSSDISERKRIEAEQEKLQTQIRQSQKLESLGVLAGGIAHDFNNLLLGILGNAGLALQELSPLSPARESVQQIETAAIRTAELTRQMLAYSGKGKFVIQPIDLSELVEEMAYLLEVSITKNVVLRYNFAKNLPAVEVDVSQLRQVVMNLITNASDAIGERSGLVTLTTGALDADDAYFRETFASEDLRPGQYVYLEVADTGCGMDADTKDRVYDPFYTTKKSGRGLGMAAVLGIVRGHGGTIKIYSELGQGTTFKILLPASRTTARPLHVEQQTTDDWSGSGTVFVVDDDETVRSVTKRVLEHYGFDVMTAEDGREAVEVFANRGDGIALVLLDMTMPHMSGEETYRELRRIRDDVRVVLTSGYNEQEATNRFAGKGLAGFIQKPYRPKELMLVIQSALEQPAE